MLINPHISMVSLHCCSCCCSANMLKDKRNNKLSKKLSGAVRKLPGAVNNFQYQKSNTQLVIIIIWSQSILTNLIWFSHLLQMHTTSVKVS